MNAEEGSRVLDAEYLLHCSLLMRVVSALFYPDGLVLCLALNEHLGSIFGGPWGMRETNRETPCVEAKAKITWKYRRHEGRGIDYSVLPEYSILEGEREPCSLPICQYLKNKKNSR